MVIKTPASTKPKNKPNPELSSLDTAVGEVLHVRRAVFVPPLARRDASLAAESHLGAEPTKTQSEGVGGGEGAPQPTRGR